jgi:hypothetical protein
MWWFPIKWKTLSLQDKLNIMQKGKENLGYNKCSDVYVIFKQFLGDPLY